MKILMAPIFTLVMLTGPSNMAVNLNNLCKDFSQKNVAKMFDLTVLKEVLNGTKEVRKAVEARNELLNNLLNEIDG